MSKRCHEHTMRDFIFAERVNNMQRKPNLRFHFLCSGFINIENNLKFVEKKNTPWFSKPFPGFSKTSKKKWEYGVTIMQSGLWLFFFFLFLLLYGFSCSAQRWSPRAVKRLTGRPASSDCNRSESDQSQSTVFEELGLSDCVIFFFYLSPDGLEFMTQSKYSLAAKASSTLFTSLVKLPSTCLRLKSTSDLRVYNATMQQRSHVIAAFKGGGGVGE